MQIRRGFRGLNFEWRLFYNDRNRSGRCDQWKLHEQLLQR